MPPASRKAPPRAAKPERAAAVPLAWSVALGAAMLALYGSLALRVTGDEDAAEITLGLLTGGVLHPPGYPLFTLLGGGFVTLARALGAGYALAANAWAAVGAAVAMVLLHRLALELLPRTPALPATARFVLAAVPVVAFGMNPQWTAEATIVEVHSWHVAWLAGLVLLFARTVEVSTGKQPPPLARRMLAWGFMCGIGGAHQTMALFPVVVLTAALVWTLARSRAFRFSYALLWLAGALPPLASYGILYWHATHPAGAAIWPTLEPTWGGVWRHVTGALYRGYLGRWHPDPEQAAALARDVYPFLWPALMLLAWSAVAARGFGPRITRGALVGIAVVQLAFVYRYGVPDPVAYFLPPLMLSLLALPWLAALAAARIGRAPVLGVAAFCVVALGAWGMPAALERRRELTRHDEAIRSMWNAVPDRPSILLWPADEYVRLLLLQRLEGQRPDVAVYNTAMLCNDQPARRFATRFGFDPLANNDPSHARDAIDPRYFAGSHASWDPRYLARVNQTIADSARVPVLLFDDTRMRLRRIDSRP